MGAVDLGGDRGGKKKGLRRAKRRISIRLDMTPMVDIAFLLLIFYMVATVFAEPQAMEINLPPLDDTEQLVKESKVLTVRVNPDDRIFWNTGKDDPVEIDMADISKLLEEKVRDVPELITLLKINKQARYSRMVELLDRIEIVEYRFRQAQVRAKENGTLPQDTEEFSYTFSLGPWSRLDTKTIERVLSAEGTENEGTENEGTAEGETSP